MTQEIREDVQEGQYPDQAAQSWSYITYRSQGAWYWEPGTLSPKRPETRSSYSSREEADQAAREWIEQQGTIAEQGEKAVSSQ